MNPAWLWAENVEYWAIVNYIKYWLVVVASRAFGRVLVRVLVLRMLGAVGVVRL